MEQKVDVERAVYADFVKPSASMGYRKVIYTLVALSSLVFGAFAMALFYHWNEIQSIDNRLEIQDVKEVIRLTDILLAKHESNAANVEKLLTLFQQQQQLRMVDTGKQQNVEANYESNLTFNEAKDRNLNRPEIRNDGKKSMKTGPGSTTFSNGEDKDNQPKPVSTDYNTSSVTVHRMENELTNQSATPDLADENQSAGGFHWKFSIPRSAWLQLSPFGISYGASSESSDNQILSKEME